MQTVSSFTSTVKLAIAMSFLFGACSGSISGDAPSARQEDDGDAPSDDTPDIPSSPPNTGGGTGGASQEPLHPMEAEALCAASGPAVGRAKVRRLTTLQYANTVRDLLKASTVPTSSFLPDTKEGPFDTNTSVPATELAIEKYEQAAVTLASSTNLDAILPCKAASGNDACANDFIDRFGLRAYRRPLSSDEQASLRKLYNLGKSDSFETGVRLVIEGVLQSPNFLYLFEYPPTNEDSKVLEPYETATRLSYLFWNSMPDDELFTAAKDGKLSSKEQLVAQAERLLSNERAKATLDAFHTQWMGIDKLEQIEKDPAKYPQYGPALIKAMRTETESFARKVILEGDATVQTLLTANWSAPDDDAVLAIYGAKRGDLANGRLALDSSRRAGLLTQPAVLSRWASEHASAVYRGILVRENILCDELGAPPEAVSFELPPNADQLSAQEILREHQNNAACNACHRLMENIGFGLENFDLVGTYRTKVGNVSVDASGELVETDVDGKFSGPRELADKLAQSEQVKSCVAVQWFRYALGRSPTDADACSVAAINKAARESGGNIRDMLVSLVATDAFRLIHAE